MRVLSAHKDWVAATKGWRNTATYFVLNLKTGKRLDCKDAADAQKSAQELAAECAA